MQSRGRLSNSERRHTSEKTRAPAKHVGVPALQAYDCGARLSKLQQQLVDLTLHHEAGSRQQQEAAAV